MGLPEGTSQRSLAFCPPPVNGSLALDISQREEHVQAVEVGILPTELCQLPSVKPI